MLLKVLLFTDDLLLTQALGSALGMVATLDVKRVSALSDVAMRHSHADLFVADGRGMDSPAEALLHLARTLQELRKSRGVLIASLDDVKSPGARPVFRAGNPALVILEGESANVLIRTFLVDPSGTSAAIDAHLRLRNKLPGALHELLDAAFRLGPARASVAHVVEMLNTSRQALSQHLLSAALPTLTNLLDLCCSTYAAELVVRRRWSLAAVRKLLEFSTEPAFRSMIWRTFEVLPSALTRLDAECGVDRLLDAWTTRFLLAFRERERERERERRASAITRGRTPRMIPEPIPLAA